MATSYAIWFTVLGLSVYICTVDPNVPLFLSLLGRSLNPKLRGALFLVWENPDLPWVRWRIRLHYNKQARLLRRELGLPETDD